MATCREIFTFGGGEGGVNPSGQPDRFFTVFFFDRFPYLRGWGVCRTGGQGRRWQCTTSTRRGSSWQTKIFSISFSGSLLQTNIIPRYYQCPIQTNLRFSNHIQPSLSLWGNLDTQCNGRQIESELLANQKSVRLKKKRLLQPKIVFVHFLSFSTVIVILYQTENKKSFDA